MEVCPITHLNFRNHFNVNWHRRGTRKQLLDKELTSKGKNWIAWAVQYCHLEFYPNWSLTIWRCDIRKTDNPHLHWSLSQKKKHSSMQMVTWSSRHVSIVRRPHHAAPNYSIPISKRKRSQRRKPIPINTWYFVVIVVVAVVCDSGLDTKLSIVYIHLCVFLCAQFGIYLLSFPFVRCSSSFQ